MAAAGATLPIFSATLPPKGPVARSSKISVLPGLEVVRAAAGLSVKAAVDNQSALLPFQKGVAPVTTTSILLDMFTSEAFCRLLMPLTEMVKPASPAPPSSRYN